MPARRLQNVPLDSRGKPYKPGGPTSAGQKAEIGCGTRLKVYWPGMKRFYSGTIASVDERGLYTMHYDDGEVLKVRLGNVIWDYDHRQQPKDTSVKPYMDKKQGTAKTALVGTKRKRPDTASPSDMPVPQAGSKSLEPVEGSGRCTKKRRQMKEKPVRFKGRKSQRGDGGAGVTNETDLGKRVRKPSVLLREILGGTMVGSESMDGYALAAADLVSGDHPPGKMRQGKRQASEPHSGSKQHETPFPPSRPRESGSISLLSKDGSISGGNLPFLTSPTDISSQPSPQSPEGVAHFATAEHGPISPHDNIAVELSTPAPSPRVEDLRGTAARKPVLQTLHRRKGMPAKATLPESERSISPAARPQRLGIVQKPSDSDSSWGLGDEGKAEEKKPRWEGTQRRTPPTGRRQKKLTETTKVVVAPSSAPRAKLGRMDVSQKLETAETARVPVEKDSRGLRPLVDVYERCGHHSSEQQIVRVWDSAGRNGRHQASDKMEEDEGKGLRIKGGTGGASVGSPPPARHRVVAQCADQGAVGSNDWLAHILLQMRTEEEEDGKEKGFDSGEGTAGGGDDAKSEREERREGGCTLDDVELVEAEDKGGEPIVSCVDQKSPCLDQKSPLEEGQERRANSAQKGLDSDRDPAGCHRPSVAEEPASVAEEPVPTHKEVKGNRVEASHQQLGAFEALVAGSLLRQPAMLVDCTGVVLESGSKLMAGSLRPEDILLNKLRENPLKKARAVHCVEKAGGLTAWLDGMGLQRAKELFAKANLTAREVVMLTRADLRMLGLAVGSQVRIMAALWDLFQDS